MAHPSSSSLPPSTLHKRKNVGRHAHRQLGRRGEHEWKRLVALRGPRREPMASRKSLLQTLKRVHRRSRLGSVLLLLLRLMLLLLVLGCGWRTSDRGRTETESQSLQVRRVHRALSQRLQQRVLRPIPSHLLELSLQPQSQSDVLESEGENRVHLLSRLGLVLPPDVHEKNGNRNALVKDGPPRHFHENGLHDEPRGVRVLAVRGSRRGRGP